MHRICPNPWPWSQAFQRLTQYAESRPCSPASPPRPLILAGWVYSNDMDKAERWAETVAWAKRNGCADLVADIPETDFYFVCSPTAYAVGPFGGPMYRRWDHERRDRPSRTQLADHLASLMSRWPDVVGQELSKITRPAAFSGRRARRLVVSADADTKPPWGEWSCLSSRALERRTFTNFRAAINVAIAPHEVDHIEFSTKAFT